MGNHAAMPDASGEPACEKPPVFEFAAASKETDEGGLEQLLQAAAANGYQWVTGAHRSKPKTKMWKIKHQRTLIGQCDAGDKDKLCEIIRKHSEKAAAKTSAATSASATATATATASKAKRARTEVNYDETVRRSGIFVAGPGRG